MGGIRSRCYVVVIMLNRLTFQSQESVKIFFSAPTKNVGENAVLARKFFGFCRSHLRKARTCDDGKTSVGVISKTVSALTTTTTTTATKASKATKQRNRLVVCLSLSSSILYIRLQFKKATFQHDFHDHGLESKGRHYDLPTISVRKRRLKSFGVISWRRSPGEKKECLLTTWLAKSCLCVSLSLFRNAVTMLEEPQQMPFVYK